MRASNKQIQYIKDLYAKISGGYIPDTNLSDLSSAEAQELIKNLKKRYKRIKDRWRYEDYY